MLLRPCSHPGCPALVRSGRCPAHRTPAHTTSAPGHAAVVPPRVLPRFDHLHKPFYNSRAWKLARSAYLLLHPICETCRRAPSSEVHHKVSLQDIAERRIPEWVRRLGIDLDLVDLRLDDRNFLAQCKPCHSRETVRQDGGFGRTPMTRYTPIWYRIGADTIPRPWQEAELLWQYGTSGRWRIRLLGNTDLPGVLRPGTERDATPIEYVLRDPQLDGADRPDKKRAK